MLLHDTKIWGVTTIGARGQLVIPAKLREELGVRPGEEFVVISRGKSKAIMLMTEETMTQMLEKSLDKIENLKNQTKGSK